MMNEENNLQENIEKLKVVELRAKLDAFNIEHKGLRKAALIEKLKNVLEAARAVENEFKVERAIEKHGKVTDVSLDGVEGWDGIVIKTEGDTIHILIDNQSNCCEEWGFSMNTANIKAKMYANDHNAEHGWEEPEYTQLAETMVRLEGSTIVDVKWNCKREQANKHKYECGGLACVDIVCENWTVEIDAWNDHNGYYPHELWTKWANHEDKQDL